VEGITAVATAYVMSKVRISFVFSDQSDTPQVPLCLPNPRWAQGRVRFSAFGDPHKLNDPGISRQTLTLWTFASLPSKCVTSTRSCLSTTGNRSLRYVGALSSISSTDVRSLVLTPT
jgi:hypothetical protein